MKITEKMLLDGYKGVCGDAITAISEVDGRELRWSYRQPETEDSRVVTENRDEAESITLEYDRVGDIALDGDLTPAQLAAAEKHAENCRREWGEEI